jgi:hypothetical protein
MAFRLPDVHALSEGVVSAMILDHLGEAEATNAILSAIG